MDSMAFERQPGRLEILRKEMAEQMKKDQPMKVELSNEEKAYQAIPPKAAPPPGIASQDTGVDPAMSGLLERVLMHVAETSPPEDVMAVCSVLSKGLASVLMRDGQNMRNSRETQVNQMMGLLRQELDRQASQRATAAQYYPPQLQGMEQQGQDASLASLIMRGLQQSSGSVPPQQQNNLGMSQMMQVLQQEISKQQSAPGLVQHPPSSAPVPPQERGHDSHAAYMQTVQMLQLELERQRSQPVSQMVAASMLDTAQNIATTAAQRSAAAWQQEQMTAWQTEIAFKKCMEKGRGKGPMASPCTPPGPPPGIFAPSPDVGQQCLGGMQQMQWPGPSAESYLTPLQFPGEQRQTPGTLPSSTAAAAWTGHKGSLSDNNYKGAQKGNANGGNRKGAGRGEQGNGSKKGGKGGASGAAGGAKGNAQYKGPALKKRAPDPRTMSGGAKGYTAGGNGPNEADEDASGFDKSLRSNLEVLCGLDPKRIVHCRKINRLGFHSAQVLRAQLSRYGTVSQVLVSHCYARNSANHFRPSGLGFVVMSSTEEAQAILANGPELPILNDAGGPRNAQFPGELEACVIHVQGFRPNDDLNDEEHC